jgi:hypothetical protein
MNYSGHDKVRIKVGGGYEQLIAYAIQQLDA